MELLVIGGTRFVGRHIVEAAQARGHEVTLFNRGSHREVFPELELIRGDRDDDLSPLAGRRWDAVIDTCGYLPRQVRAAAETLAGAVERYLFISTISVYSERNTAYLDEQGALAELDDPDVQEVTGETYGGLKVRCERELWARLPEAALVVRPGVVVGPYDPTDRMSYWPLRFDRGGEVLLPDAPRQPVQWIDARDLADWLVMLLERGERGTFNAVSEPDRFTLGALFDACAEAAGGVATDTPIAEAFLLEQGVVPFRDLPLWIPGEGSNFLRLSNARAAAAGLRVRPLADSVRDTLRWGRDVRVGEALRAGLAPERERELLAAWHARRS